MAYEYVKSLNQYRDAKTKRFVANETVLQYVQAIVDGGTGQGDQAVSLYLNGQLSAIDFGTLFKQELKYAYLQQGMLGKGGREQMTFSDWGYIGRQLQDEYRLIDGFVDALSDLSEAQIRARSANYFKASRAAYERSRARAFGIPDLPAYPGDGSTVCVNGCACSWDIQRLEGEGNFDCYWELGIADHCETCLTRAGSWNPIEIRDGVIGNYQDIRI